MRVIKDLHDGDPTIFINGRIINGCQDFTLEEAEGVFEKYRVSEEDQKVVLENYVEVSSEEEMEKFLNHENKFVRWAVARYGSEELQAKLVDDEDCLVRYAVARYGSDELRAKLLKDENWVVREAVVVYSTDPSLVKKAKDSL